MSSYFFLKMAGNSCPELARVQAVASVVSVKQPLPIHYGEAWFTTHPEYHPSHLLSQLYPITRYILYYTSSYI